MTKIIETQVMIHRTMDYARDNSIQMHRTDVSQQVFTRETVARAQRELLQTVGVKNVDGDIMIKQEQQSQQRDRKGQAAKPAQKTRAKTKEEQEAGDDRGDGSTFDVRI